MTNFLLALDQSTQTTGYAIFKDGELIRSGHVSPTGEYITRIVKLRAWVNQVINTLLAFSEDAIVEVAIEDIQLQEFEPNGGKRVSRDLGVTTFKKLAHVQGALLTLFEELKIKYHIVPSATWKNQCKITGKKRDEQKRKAQEFVITNYNIKPTQDEADAVCIGHSVLKKEPQTSGFDWS